MKFTNINQTIKFIKNLEAEGLRKNAIIEAVKSYTDKSWQESSKLVNQIIKK